MPNTDHRLGYTPATRADWGEGSGEPCLDWRHRPAEVEPSVSTPRLTPASGRCMTISDALGVAAMAQEGPQPAPGEPNEPGVMVTLPNGAGMRFTMPLLEAGIEGVTDAVAERPTLSPAAEWPFAGQGWRNGDGGLGAQCERVRLEKLKAAAHEQWLQRERVRLEKLKAAEHEKWLQRQQSAMWSSQQMYSDEKVRHEHEAFLARTVRHNPVRFG